MVFLFRAAPTGYLPAADDYEYEEDLAGYKASSDDLAAYGDDDLSGYGDGQAEYGDDQYQYGVEQEEYEDDQYQNEELSRGEPKTEGSKDKGYAAPAGAAASDLGRPADEEYGAPAFGSESNVDPNYAAPDDGYGASGANTGYTDHVEAVAKNVDEGYAVSAGAGADADEEYGAPNQYQGNHNGFPFAIVEGRQRQGSVARPSGSSARPDNGESKQCPGGSLAMCVEVCPGNSARVYGACVQGCAIRCPQL